MAMALADLEVAVDAMCERVGLDLAGPRAQAHGAAELVDAAQLAQLIDDAVRGGLIELARIRAFEHANVPRKLDACRLHAEANAEVGDFFLASVADRVQHAFDATLPESTRNEDAVVIFELRFVLAAVFCFDALCFYPGDAQLQIVRERTVDQRFLQRLVRILVLDILSDN